MKKSIFKVMSFLLVLAIMIPVAVLPSMAATSYKDSVASVDQTDSGTTVGYDETQGKSTTYVDNVNGDSDNQVDVYVTQASTFNVKLPKTIILNGTYGQTNSGAYEVEVEGNLASDEVVTCTLPHSDFALKSTGKADITASVEQSKTEFTYADGVRIGQPVKATGTVTAHGMTAGKWHGQYQFNINISKTLNKNLIKYFTWGEDTFVTTSVANGTLATDFPDLVKMEPSELTTYSYPDKTQITGLTEEGIAWLQGNGGKLIMPECASSTGQPTNYTNMVFGSLSYNGAIKNLITSVCIPNSMKLIGGGTFACQENLKSVFFNNVERVAGSAFYGCSGLEYVDLNNNISKIPTSLFHSCVNLRKIDGCSNVKEIANTAFTYCYMLEEIDTLENCETIGKGAFFYCYNLKNIKLNPLKLKSVDGGTRQNAFIHTSIPMSYWRNFTNTNFNDEWIYPNNVNVDYNYTYSPYSMDIKGFSQNDVRWGDRKIASNVADDVIFSTRGCSWMCLTSIYNYLNNKNWTPVDMSSYFEENYPDAIPDNFNGSFKFNNTAGRNGLLSLGLKYSTIKVSNADFCQNVMDALSQGKPVILYINFYKNEPTGHFLTLTGVDENGNVCFFNSSIPTKSISQSGFIDTKNIQLSQHTFSMPLENLISSYSFAYIFEKTN